MTPKEFLEFAKKHKAEMVDLKFVDMLGTWQHCTFPIDLWDAGTFKDGLGFDGSSIRGWMGIHESDMLAVPDADTVCLDPFFAEPTVSVIANIVDPLTRKDFSRDPRHVARKAEAYLQEVRHGRHLLHRARARVLHLRRGPLRAEPASRLLPDRLGRRRLEHGAASKSRTSATNRASRAATFRSARPTRSTICAARWSARCGRSASSSKRITTKWPRPVRARSTCSSSRCARWPISSCGTSTSARTSRSGTARP